MSPRWSFSRFWRDQRGSAGEFALVLPLAMLMFVGMLDVGRFAYEFNRGEKATQTGTRWAVVTDPIASGLTTESYVGIVVGGVTINQGDRIPAGALGVIRCDDMSCTCATSPCPASLTRDSAAFDALLGRMQDILPGLEADNLVVEYSGSGLGYAGNPDGMDVAPLVTVHVEDFEFQAILLFGGTVSMPEFSYSLTMEDGNGTGSN